MEKAKAVNEVNSYNLINNPPFIIINNKRFWMYRIFVGYRDEDGQKVRPIYHWSLPVCDESNCSDVFEIGSVQIRGLISKIQKHPYVLARPYSLVNR